MQSQNLTVINGSGNTRQFWPLGTMEALAIVFVALRLRGDIAWSWWWVLAPVWGVLALRVLVEVVATAARSAGGAKAE